MTFPVRIAAGLTCALVLAAAATSPASAHAAPHPHRAGGPQHGLGPGHGHGHGLGRIVYWQYDADFSTPSMVSIRADGTGRTVLDPAGPPRAVDYSPHWDATGRNITFFRALAGTGDEEGTSDLWTMRSDGTHVRQLTRLGDVENPVSSPDGRLIAFEREVSVGPRTEQDIWLVRTDGSHLRNLTRTPDAVDIWPRWANRGERLAYSTAGPDGTGIDIVLQDVRTREISTLANDPEAVEIIPTFSPDDRFVAYRRSNGDERGIYVDRAGRHQPHLLVAGGGYADWSSDGRRIAVVSQTGDGSSLVTVRPDGARERVLVETSELLFEPDWSPGRAERRAR